MKKQFIIIACTICVAGLLFLVDPQQSVYAPKCMFFLTTGLQCPACGTQRAIYHALHFNFAKALSYNAFLLISLPYLLALVATHWFDPRHKLERLRRICHHPVTVRTYLVLIILWWVGRNLWR